MTRSVRPIFLILTMALMFASVKPVSADTFMVGSGTPASCTEVAFGDALNEVKAAGSGTIAFNCGGAAAILFSAAKDIDFDVTMDGGGLITLSGGNANRLFIVEAGANLALQNITLANGYSSLDDGGAIYNLGSLTLVNTTIRDSNTGSDASGGAIVSYGPMNISGSRFENNAAGNGGALYVRWEAGDAVINSSTFKQNHTTNQVNGWGGAILIWDGADVVISASDLDGNTARYGGAIHNMFSNSELELKDGTRLRNNQAQFDGGAIYNVGATSNTYTHVSFTNNRATDFGGAIYNSGGSISLSDSEVANNTATAGVGGGVYNNSNAVAWLTYSTVHDNGAMFGAGIYNGASQLILINATVSTNFSNSGGGIYNNSRGNAQLTFVTLSGNVAYADGGGIYNNNSTDTNLYLRNTIVADNEGGNCFGKLINSALFSLWSDSSCAALGGAGNKPNTPAQLGPLAANGGLTLTHMPSANSPAVDSGQCDVDIPNDQRGRARPQGLNCDIGSVERQPEDGSQLVFLPMALK